MLLHTAISDSVPRGVVIVSLRDEFAALESSKGVFDVVVTSEELFEESESLSFTFAALRSLGTEPLREIFFPNIEWFYRIIINERIAVFRHVPKILT